MKTSLLLLSLLIVVNTLAVDHSFANTTAYTSTTIDSGAAIGRSTTTDRSTATDRSTTIDRSTTTMDDISKATQHGKKNMLQSFQATERGLKKAFALYKLAGISTSEDRMVNTREYLYGSISILEDYLLSASDDVQALALASSIYGWQYALGAFKDQDLAVKSSTLLNKAMALDAKSPYVNFVRAIIKFHTPTEYGGSKDEALAILKRAIKFRSQSNIHSQDNIRSQNRGGDLLFTEEEAYVWRGQFYIGLNKHKRAIKDFKKSLEIDPEYLYAKGLLNKHKNH